MRYTWPVSVRKRTQHEPGSDSAFTSLYTRYKNELVVTKGGGQYTTIAAVTHTISSNSFYATRIAAS